MASENVPNSSNGPLQVLIQGRRDLCGHDVPGQALEKYKLKREHRRVCRMDRSSQREDSCNNPSVRKPVGMAGLRDHRRRTSKMNRQTQWMGTGWGGAVGRALEERRAAELSALVLRSMLCDISSPGDGSIEYGAP